MAALIPLLLAVLLLLASPAQAGASPQELRLPLPPELAQRLRYEGELPVRLFLPAGDGPFPLALIHHERRFFNDGPPNYPAATAYFLARGFAVAVPLRVGYGELGGLGDREYMNCRAPDPGRVFSGISLQAAAVLEGLSARGLPIDRRRVLHVGVGVGGMAALSSASLSPQGVLGAINFGGGVGGYAERFPRQPCGVAQTIELNRRLGKAAAKVATGAPPTLWLYAENDLLYGSLYPRRWHLAYRRGGGAARFEMLAPWGHDGNELFVDGNELFVDGIERWRPLVDAFLNSLPAAGVPAPESAS